MMEDELIINMGVIIRGDVDELKLLMGDINRRKIEVVYVKNSVNKLIIMEE